LKLSLLLLILSILITLCQSTGDCNNPLLAPANEDGPTGVGSPVTAAASNKVCPNLAGESVCCTDTSIADIATKVKDKVKDINKFSAKRDVYINNLGNSMKTMIDQVNTLQSLVASFKAGYSDIYPGFVARFSTVYNMLLEWRDVAQNFKAIFISLQQERKKCYTITLQYYAAAQCLACDPNYASLGVSGTSTDPIINYSPRVCRKMAEECYTYFALSAEMTSIQYLSKAKPLIRFITKKINAAMDTGYATALLGENMPVISVSDDGNNFETPSAFPDVLDCFSSDNCVWACENLIPNGKLQSIELGIGGLNVTNVTVYSPTRLLSGAPTFFNPEVTDSGVSFSVSRDPANVNPNKAILKTVAGWTIIFSGLVAWIFA